MTVNGISLGYYEWGRRMADRPSLLFVHATGFHGRIWDSIIEAFPEHHCISIDQRCHGRSKAPPVESWLMFGDDLCALARELELQAAIGIGHSLGGHTLLDAAAQGRFCSRLILLDPVIFEPQHYANAGIPVAQQNSGEHPVARRRATFSSVEEFSERLSGKSSFPRFTPRAFRDYCQYALTPDEAGFLHLACPAESEARVYQTSRSSTRILQSIRDLDIPALVIRAQNAERSGVMDFSSSPTWQGLAGMLAQGRDEHWSDCCHFIPMERPQAIIDTIRAELAAAG